MNAPPTSENAKYAPVVPPGGPGVAPHGGRFPRRASQDAGKKNALPFSRALAACAALALALAAPDATARAGIIPTPLVGYEDASRTPTTVPFLVSASPQNRLFASFSVPDAEQIQSLNAVRVFVTARDDGDNRDETAEVFLNVIGDRILLGEIIGPPDTPTEFAFALDPSFFDEALSRMQSSNRILAQVRRGDGDLVVEGVRLEVDAVLASPVPEPSTLALLACGGATGLLALRRRRGKTVSVCSVEANEHMN
jgi:hypothetical protein